MSKARVILVGVGNAASSLIQALEYYAKSGKSGLKYETIGGMRLEDIEIVSAYDVVKNKVGKDLNEAMKREIITRSEYNLKNGELDLFPDEHAWGANKSVAFFEKWLGQR